MKIREKRGEIRLAHSIYHEDPEAFNTASRESKLPPADHHKGLATIYRDRRVRLLQFSNEEEKMGNISLAAEARRRALRALLLMGYHSVMHSVHRRRSR